MVEKEQKGLLAQVTFELYDVAVNSEQHHTGNINIYEPIQSI